MLRNFLKTLQKRRDILIANIQRYDSLFVRVKEGMTKGNNTVGRQQLSNIFNKSRHEYKSYHNLKRMVAREWMQTSPLSVNRKRETNLEPSWFRKDP